MSWSQATYNDSSRKQRDEVGLASEREVLEYGMDLDDLEPKKVKAYELGQDLSKLSVGELAELIETLKQEIARVEAVRAAKQSSRSAADAAFKR
jgi:uncharacterized small protein (DUF1192 family)